MQPTTSLIISFNGQEGSGKSTLATLIATKLNIPRFYMGQVFRDMAKEKGLTLQEFRKICDNDPSFDNKIDTYVASLPTKQDSFVIEGRTAWHFIPQSIKVYLQVDPTIAAERIFEGLKKENNRGNEDANLGTVVDIRNSILQRRKEDSERFLSFYGINQDDAKNYDLIVDTTHLSINEVFDKILAFIHEKSN